MTTYGRQETSMLIRMLAAGALIIGTSAPAVAATDPSVSIQATTNDGVTTFKGEVDDGPRSGMVHLQQKKGKWRTVATSDFTPKGYTMRYPTTGGTYRVVAPLKTWYNSRQWFDRLHGDLHEGPANVRSEPVRMKAAPQTAQGKRWVVGVGDSYMSGEGASYAGYGPWCGNKHDRVFSVDCNVASQSDNWWVSAFGSSLKQTYPGDFEQPIAQPGLPTPEGYAVPTPGVRCHRSASALMMWNRPDYAGVNLACSGAVVETRLSTGKPGIDFVDEQTQSNGRIVGQALQLQRFAEQAGRNGDEVAVVSMSIGGNDVGFADIIADCVKRYLTPTSRACWRANSDSEARKAFDDGKGLTKARAAVLTGGRNIIKALDNAEVARGSYRILIQTPPIGVPPANQFEKDFGGDNGYGRQGIGGCGFTDGDLDFFNGEFGSLLRQRMVEGARSLKNEFPDVKVTVVDASRAFADHQLCSEKLNYPQTRGNGDNTMQPAWTGEWGGRRGTWMTPIIITCMGLDWGPVCTRDSSPAVTVPTLWRAVSGSGDYRSPGWQEGVTQMAQLPAHPNFWGQRALASCHSDAALDDATVGKVVACTPGSNDGLNAYGRPNMRTVVSGGL
jgi:hypothetical protein